MYGKQTGRPIELFEQTNASVYCVSDAFKKSVCTVCPIV